MRKNFEGWEQPKFNKEGKTKWHWVCQYHEHLSLGKYCDIGAFTYINAHFGVVIEEEVQIGSHCSIYSHSTIDDKKGRVVIKKGARIGTHSTIMPGVTIGENAIVGAYSFVKNDIPSGALVVGIPAKTAKKIK